MAQLHFAQTDKVVAQDPAFVFQPFVNADDYLRGGSVPPREYRSAHHRRES